MEAADKFIKTSKEPSPNKRHKKQVEDSAPPPIVADALELQLLVEFLPFYDLPTVASVCKEWRAVASISYMRRINIPWNLPKNNNNQITTAKQLCYPEKHANLWRLHQEKETSKENRIQVIQQLKQQDNGDQWRYVPKTPEVYGWSCGVEPDAAAILPNLPLEKDMPQVLLQPETELDSCFLLPNARLLFLTLVRPWSPKYSWGLDAMDMEDNYQDFADRHADLMGDEEAHFDVDDFQDDVEADPPPGADLWGLLYHVSNNNDVPSSRIQLVDMQRITGMDFPYFHQSGVKLVTSANGKVACLETGLRDPDDPTRCIPTIITLHLSRENGIQKQTSLAGPSVDGFDLEDSYGSFLALTPSGDHLLIDRGDFYNLDALSFYKFDKGGRWEELWQGKGRDLEGYFTPDGDFVVTNDKTGGETNMPGPLAVKQLLVLEPT